MAVKHGKLARLYFWDGTATDMTDEACSESGVQGQITAAAKRRLNPNAPPVFTDSDAAVIKNIDFINGIADFASNVDSAVTCTGEYVAQGNMAAVGYITDWSIDINLETADESAMGDSWRAFKAGLASWSATATGFFEDDTFGDYLTAEASLVEKRLYLIEFYVAAPADLDRYVGWGFVEGVQIGASLGDLIKRPITIKGFKNIAYFTS